MGVKTATALSIKYFDQEGSDANLQSVLTILKRAFKKRPELRSHKLVFFTSYGEGPALAYQRLQDFSPNIIAVTFPPDFIAGTGDKKFHPAISHKIQRFFDGVGIRVITGRLPFDTMEGAEDHNQEMKLVTDVLTMFCGSFHLCVQAVLQTCDAGVIAPGEDVIAITGDCAAIITASFTKNFLGKEGGMVVREILCKPRTLNMARKQRSEPTGQTQIELSAVIDGGRFPEATPPKRLGEGNAEKERNE